MVSNKRRPAIATLLFVVLALTMVLAAACGSASPAASPPSSASSKASAPAASSAAPSPSASAKAPSPEEQAYQKMQEDWKQVVAAAQKEDPATIYSVFTDDFNQKFRDAFNKIDPKIQVNFARFISVQVMERFQAEQSTKQYVGNAYLGAARRISKSGLGQPVDLLALHEPGVKWLMDPLMDKPAGLDTIVNSANKFVLIYNTNLVPAGQEPKTWTDLTDPKYKNQVALWDPHNPGIGQSLTIWLYGDSKHGPDMARKFLENVVVTPDSGGAAQLVAKGEAKVGIITWGDYLAVKDGPVKLSMPQDGDAGNQTYSLMIKNAPQPNTTRVFLNWLMGKEGQSIIAQGYATIRGDVQAAAKDAQIMPGAKWLDHVPEDADYELNTHAEIAKKIVAMLTEIGK